MLTEDLQERLERLFLEEESLFGALKASAEVIIEISDASRLALVVQKPTDQKPLMVINHQADSKWVHEKVKNAINLCQAIQGGESDLFAGIPKNDAVYFLISSSLPEAILFLGFQNDHELDKENSERLEEVCQFLGEKIHQERSSTAILDSVAHLSRINSVFSDLDHKSSLDEVQLKIVNEIREVMKCEAASIVFIGLSPEDVLVKKSLISVKDWVYRVGVKNGEGLIGSILETGRSLLTNDPIREPHFKESFDGIPGLEPKAMIYVPMIENGSLVGVIQVINKENGRFTDLDLKLLISLVNSIVKPLIFLQSIHQLRVINAHLEASRWELIRSRNTLRSLIDNLPDSLYIINRMYRIVAINSARSNRIEGDPRALVGNICFESLYNRTEPCPNCQVPETFFNKKVTHRTERDWQESGEAYEWEINSYPIFDETGAVIQVILVEKDVTDRRRMEMIVSQSEKMAAVGQLAAGIAHEINNPLTVVLANAQILMRELPEQEDWRELADLINRAGTRALHTVRNLLDFARREQLDFEEIDINETIERAIEMLHHELVGRSVELTYHPATGLPRITASAGNLQSVWLNLIMNGLDSINNENGKIIVKSAQKGREIRVSITDNGQGIPEDGLKRIFEPFYTTKDPGKGTGLGLSICHRIVKQHGGYIEVDSQVGKGTIFTVVLPTY